MQTFTYPLLVGDGAGATFAYAVDAQAPKGTFTALVTLGWDTTFRLPKPVCRGDAGAVTVADAAGQFRIAPVSRMPNPWLPQPFAPGARNNGVAGDSCHRRSSVLLAGDRAQARRNPVPRSLRISPG